MYQTYYTLCLSHLQTFFFTLAGEYLTARLREWTFKAMLRQEMGWFDDKFNSTGALTTRLASDAAQVQGATGSRLGVLIQVAFSLLLSVAIAFAYSWSLTFIIIGFVPIVMAAGAIQVKTVTGFTKSNKKNLEEAGKIAVESIENIRTVAGLHRENTFYELYSIEVDRIHRRSLLAPLLAGLLYGFSQGILIFGYAIVFRYGAFQVAQRSDSVIYAPFFDIFMYVCTVLCYRPAVSALHAQFLLCLLWLSIRLSACSVFNALIFGAVAAGQAGSFAPNYAKARVSANRIFALINRIPAIDTYSPEGEKPEKVTHHTTVDETPCTAIYIISLCMQCKCSNVQE